MKRQILFSFVVSIFLFIAGQANAVVIGDNVRSPRISIFSENRGDGVHYGQVVAGGTQEIISKNQTLTLAAGVVPYYHITLNHQSKYIPYSTTVVPVVPVLYPAFAFVTPNVLVAVTGAVAPGFTPQSPNGGWFGSGGLATSATVQYIVQGFGFRVKNNTTGALVGRFSIQAINATTKLQVWTKTFVDAALFINPERCLVTDIDGDGNDELVLQFSQRATPTTVTKTLQVFNLATGLAKRANLVWVDNE